jgi:hypothetical protein
MRPIAWALMFVALGAGPLHAQAGEILGTWHGTSTCVKEDWNKACNDEQVIYHVTGVPGRPDSVSLDADKVVDGKPEPMGTLAFGYDATTKSWIADWSNARYHLLWSFQVKEKTLTGTLFLLPDRRVARHIAVKKD